MHVVAAENVTTCTGEFDASTEIVPVPVEHELATAAPAGEGSGSNTAIRPAVAVRVTARTVETIFFNSVGKKLFRIMSVHPLQRDKLSYATLVHSSTVWDETSKRVHGSLFGLEFSGNARVNGANSLDADGESVG